MKFWILKHHTFGWFFYSRYRKMQLTFFADSRCAGLGIQLKRYNGENNDVWGGHFQFAWAMIGFTLTGASWYL